MAVAPSRLGLVALVAASFVAFAGAAPAQTIWNVAKNPGPTIHFTNIQAAVDAASDGDVIRIYNGSGPLFAPFVIEGKSLTVVGILATVFAAMPGISGACAVRGLGPDQSVTLARLAISNAGNDAPALAVVDCLGGVLVVDSRMHVEMPADLGSVQRSALLVERSAHVTLVDPDIWGGGASPDQLPYSGVEVRRSRLDWFGGYATGGVAGIGTSAGGIALKVDRSFVRMVGGSITGGSGATASGFPTCTPGTQGGIGLWLGEAAIVQLEDCELQGGFGGTTSQGCPGGPPGPAVVGDASGLVTDTASMRRIQVVVPVKAGSSTRFVVQGEPDDLALVLVGTALSPTALPGVVGLLAIGDAQPAVLVTVPANGIASIDGVGSIPFAGDGLVLHAQALILPADGGPLRVSAPAPIVILQ